MRMISRIRNSTSPLDMPWHLGTLRDHPLPPGGVAKVFAIKCQYSRPPKLQKGAWGITLSIREALWISRLSSLPMAIDDLEREALDYADAERISELGGTPFDTYDKDEEVYEILGYPGKAVVGREPSEGTPTSRIEV
jgi:hypothetical protein